jgi:hypothetical protein
MKPKPRIFTFNPGKATRITRELILNGLPEPGGGLNDGLLVAAIKLKEWLNCSASTVVDILLPIASERRGRDCTKEVTRQVETAFNSSGNCEAKGPKGTHYEPGLWREIGIREASLADLWEASPVKWDDGEPHSEEIIDALFPGNPWLCCGQTTYAFETRRREDLRGLLSKLSFIVPNPAISKTGMTQGDDPHESEHCLSQFPVRKYVVFEFDAEPDKDIQASIILWLATKGRTLRLVVDSGNRSLHSWFDAAGVDEDTILLTFNNLVRLGVCPGTHLRSQFVRMPDGLRDNKKRQSTIYCNVQ